MVDNKDTICMLPWESFTVTMSNGFRPCCRFKTDQAVPFEKYDEEFATLRRNMLNGKKDPRCHKCWEEEAVPKDSMRTYANRIHDLESKREHLTEKFRKPVFIEFSLDNVCNLECRMCSSSFSSKLLKRDLWLEKNHKDLEGFNADKIAKSRYETLKNLNIDWSELRFIKLLGGEPFLSPNFLDFLYFLDMRTDISKIQLEIITNCTTKMSEEVIEILNEFKFIELFGSFDGLPKMSMYQRQGSDWYSCFDNYLEYGEKLKTRSMNVHQTFSVINVSHVDESIAFYEKHSDMNSWSYDEYNFSFMNSPDWFEDWVLSRNDNQKLRKIFKNRKYDHIKWHRLLHTIKTFDEYYGTSLENANPELAKQLKINSKKYIDAHKRPSTRDCYYCDLIDEM